MHKRFTLSSRNKFMVLFVLLILLPLIILNAFVLVIQFEQNTSQYTTEQKYEFYKIPQDISDEFELAFSYATTLSQDYDMYVFLNKKYSSYQEYYTNYEGYDVAKLFSMSTVDNQNISDPILYTTNTSIYETQITQIIDEELATEKWYQAFDIEYTSAQLYFDADTRYAYITCPLMSFGTSDYLQFVMLRVDLDYISDSLDAIGTPCSAMLFDDSNSLLYTWVEGYDSIQPALFYSTIESDGATDDIALVYRENIDSYGNLKLVVAIENKNFYSLETILPTVFTLLLTLLASFLFMKNIQREYIDRIESLVESLNVDELIAGRKQSADNQLTFVEQTIGDMSGRIRDLLKKSFDLEMEKNQAEIRRKQSELNSLLSQINPHYLFNVLNAIRLKSLIKGEKETAKIILYVSKIMRGSITWNQDVITLKEEINFIFEYLAIEKYRFEDKIEYSIFSDDESLECDIPKMCLQPFIENACVHGIQNVLDTGKIEISTKVIDNKLHITIGNPVSSFSAETKMQILNYAKGNFEIDTKSVGLKNTFGRLRFYYDDVQFDIDTSVPDYVTMTLILATKVDRTAKSSLSGAEDNQNTASGEIKTETPQQINNTANNSENQAGNKGEQHE
ncbi:MAG: histidine kinase [Bacillota bacterium]